MHKSEKDQVNDTDCFSTKSIKRWGCSYQQGQLLHPVLYFILVQQLEEEDFFTKSLTFLLCVSTARVSKDSTNVLL